MLVSLVGVNRSLSPRGLSAEWCPHQCFPSLGSVPHSPVECVYRSTPEDPSGGNGARGSQSAKAVTEHNIEL